MLPTTACPSLWPCLSSFQRMREITFLALSFKKVLWNPKCCRHLSSCFSTGKTIWTLNSIHLSSGILAAPAATLPDVDGDGFRDIVVLALKETQVQRIPAQGLKEL